MTMGLLAIPINIERKNFRNSFIGIFDFCVSFLSLELKAIKSFFTSKMKNPEKQRHFLKKPI